MIFNTLSYRLTPSGEGHLRDLLQCLYDALELHDASSVVVSHDTLETWGHLARAALLLMPHHASPEDGSPPLGCTLAVLVSVLVVLLVLLVGYVCQC